MTFPFFSIIIPTYARPQQLSSCLQALSKLNYPDDKFEVIIVDDGSPISLNQIISEWQSQLNITLLKQPNQGPSIARNLGASYAKGEFLAFTDDDCIPAAAWLEEFASQLLKTPNCLIGGQIVNALVENIYATSSQLLIDYLYEYYNKQNTKTRQTSFFTSNNFAISREIFNSLGGFGKFRLAAAEDRELCDRALQLGYEMVYIPEALVYHAHHLNLVQFWQQHFNYGRGAIHFNQARANRGLGKIQPEPSPFYTNLFLYPFRQGFFYRAPLISGLLLLSQIAHSTGCFWERRTAYKK
ncbi:glycosyltransferase [Cronbergia sp. UHCC 0137]|uniref:glycosyltransferase n=1 Tax=Cronbergia sp. UHCC 0137 TaxID=3110239 RepID=UPI002B220FCE|nr:glycosyltransferase [Cronbergia sp. UHCC 0137]MEA5619321.1 glycosyltransferase [Cronbergia sp. UHCC 0137]